MKVLFLVPYPSSGASNRIRVEQYLPFLCQEKIKYALRPFMSENFFRIIYVKGHCLLKFLFFIISTISRCRDLIMAFYYDVIFIHREAFPIGPPFIEYLIKLIRKPIIFDFDDATFLPNASHFNAFIEKLKMPSKVPKIIAISDYVISGNSYLKNYALKFNKNVAVIPSSIDTSRYKPRLNNERCAKIVIGWTGSSTTVSFLKMLEETFVILCKKFPNLEIRIIGGEVKFSGRINVIIRQWKLEGELEELHNFDIGIMPMPDNDWTRGKCGFKAILYMSLGLPCVSSPVGINKEIIEDGRNGFLANTTEEWVVKLSSLIENRDLRQVIGQAGRKTVEEHFSVNVNAPLFLNAIKTVYYKRYHCKG